MSNCVPSTNKTGKSGDHSTLEEMFACLCDRLGKGWLNHFAISPRSLNNIAITLASRPHQSKQLYGHPSVGWTSSVTTKLHFVEEPIEIAGREVKRLKRSRIPLVKVRWNSKRGPEFTWEREDQFKKKYPHLFIKTAPSSSATL
ncbi:hypothetical protein Tco_0998054 [Tanacetum coccineum]